MNRRQLLRRGLLGGVLLAGAGLAAWPPAARFAPSIEPRFFSKRALAVLAAVAARIVPGCDGKALAAQVDASLAGFPDQLRNDLNGLLSLFDNALAGLIFDGRLRPFTALSDEAQDAVLASWQTSRVE